MERDDETSHYYDHARYEAFNIARFLTVDTGGGSLSNPQSLNLYVYSLDNPLKYKDPKGNDATIAVVVIVGSGLVEGISRVADYSVANPNASFTDYGRQFLIGFGGGAAAGAVAIVTTLGTHNPAIVGAAAAEADAIVEQKLEMWLGERTEWDALDVGLKTAGGAILGPVTEALVPRLGGPIPKYNKLRPLGDFIRKRNVNREVRKGLMDALLGGRMFAGVDAMTSNLSMSSIFGEGYDAFMRFLAEFDEQNSIPSGTVETGQGGFGICDEDPGHCDSKGKGDD
jgi:RHS repeat-associated protein